jgi:hypothetical protein
MWGEAQALIAGDSHGCTQSRPAGTETAVRPSDTSIYHNYVCIHLVGARDSVVG